MRNTQKHNTSNPSYLYDMQLKRFVDLCRDLNHRNLSYLSVMLSEELFRFLYPHDPYYRQFVPDRVGFVIQRIEELIVIGSSVLKTFSPYEKVNLNSDLSNKPVERKTSELYTSLWRGFEPEHLTQESVSLLASRIPDKTIQKSIVKKKVLDLGCGSGRYSIALAKLGASEVTAVDFRRESFAEAERLTQQLKLPVQFVESHVHELPFQDESFDFVLCSGVLHHTTSIEKGLRELKRVLKKDGESFLYLYAAGGIYWTTRTALREVFKEIPLDYTKQVLEFMNVPRHRFIFCDTWYVPIETLTTTDELLQLFKRLDLHSRKTISNVAFDLDKALENDPENGPIMWGDGEHRYLIMKS